MSKPNQILQNLAENHEKLYLENKQIGVEKSKVANHPKRALPKFRADQSYVRGVNGRSKFVVAERPRRDVQSVNRRRHVFLFFFVLPTIL